MGPRAPARPPGCARAPAGTRPAPAARRPLQTPAQRRASQAGRPRMASAGSSTLLTHARSWPARSPGRARAPARMTLHQLLRHLRKRLLSAEPVRQASGPRMASAGSSALLTRFRSWLARSPGRARAPAGMNLHQLLRRLRRRAQAEPVMQTNMASATHSSLLRRAPGHGHEADAGACMATRLRPHELMRAHLSQACR